MNNTLRDLMIRLEEFGAENDRTTEDRSRRMHNIKRETGEFFSVLIRAMGARKILEIGTSNGYSTLWLAEAAAATGGSVRTVESSNFKAELAKENFDKSGVAQFVRLERDDAAKVLRRAEDNSIDLLFLDTERASYVSWWPDVRRVIRPGGVLVVDNATSHVDEMAPLVSLGGSDTDFTSCVIPVGNGEFFAVKNSQR